MVMFTHRHSSGHTTNRRCKATHLNQVPLELGAVGVPSVIKNCPDAASNSIRACRNEMVWSTFLNCSSPVFNTTF
jgi:hypothetical protein